MKLQLALDTADLAVGLELRRAHPVERFLGEADALLVDDYLLAGGQPLGPALGSPHGAEERAQELIGGRTGTGPAD